MTLHQPACILGVSGTLTSLASHELEILLECGIEKFTVMPSIFRDQKRKLPDHGQENVTSRTRPYILTTNKATKHVQDWVASLEVVPSLADKESIDGVEESEMGEDVVLATVEEAELHMTHPTAPTMRAAFESLDHIQPCDHFRLRASVMKSVPKFLRGPFKNALKVALEAAIDRDVATQCRGWKLLLMLLMLPRMLLHKQPGSGQVSRAKLEERMAMFSRGDWIELIGASQTCDERSAVTRRRSQRRANNDEAKRAARAEMFVHMGELSSARQALVGEAVAPGNQATYNQLTDATRRPARPRDPLPDEILHFQPTVHFDLDEDRFCRNLRS